MHTYIHKHKHRKSTLSVCSFHVNVCVDRKISHCSSPLSMGRYYPHRHSVSVFIDLMCFTLSLSLSIVRSFGRSGYLSLSIPRIPIKLAYAIYWQIFHLNVVVFSSSCEGLACFGFSFHSLSKHSASKWRWFVRKSIDFVWFWVHFSEWIKSRAPFSLSSFPILSFYCT